MALIITIKVIPHASARKIILDAQNNIKMYVKSPAQENKANNELIDFFADVLHIPKKDICILSGFSSRLKKIKINKTITFNELLAALGLEKQNSFLK